MQVTMISLDVDNWEPMVDFYTRVLGFAPIVLEPAHGYGWLDGGRITLALKKVQNFSKTTARPFSIQFKVDNIQAAINELEQKGCKFHRVELQTGEAYKVAFFTDPENNPLAIYSVDET